MLPCTGSPLSSTPEWGKIWLLVFINVKWALLLMSVLTWCNCGLRGYVRLLVTNGDVTKNMEANLIWGEVVLWLTYSPVQIPHSPWAWLLFIADHFRNLFSIWRWLPFGIRGQLMQNLHCPWAPTNDPYPFPSHLLLPDCSSCFNMVWFSPFYSNKCRP